MNQLTPNQPPQEFVLKRIDVPFWDWVVLLIKLSIAAIPATIILMFVGFVMTTFLTLFFGSIGALITG